MNSRGNPKKLGENPAGVPLRPLESHKQSPGIEPEAPR